MSLWALYDKLEKLEKSLSETHISVGQEAFTWKALPNMPTSRRLSVAVMSGGALYVIGGEPASGYSVECESYNFNTREWTRMADRLKSEKIQGAEADGIIYTVGGYTTICYAYIVGTDTWTVKTAPTPRHDFCMVTAMGVIFAIGGSSNSGKHNEVYNAVTNTWSAKADVPTGREYVKATAIDHMIYVIGGRVPSSGNPLGTNEAYNAITNTWSTKAPLGTGQTSVPVSAVGGMIFAVTQNTSLQYYTPSINSWNKLMDTLQGGPTNSSVVTFQDEVFLSVGGDGSSKVIASAVSVPTIRCDAGDIVKLNAPAKCGEQEIIPFLENVITQGGYLKVCGPTIGYRRRS